MRGLLAAILLLAVAAAPVSAAEPTGTITIIGRTVDTVTVHVEQTGGDAVRLRLEHYCYQGDVYGGVEVFSVRGSADLTLYVGPRKYKGALVTPDDCYAMLIRTLPSATLLILDFETTWPSTS